MKALLNEHEVVRALGALGLQEAWASVVSQAMRMPPTVSDQELRAIVERLFPAVSMPEWRMRALRVAWREDWSVGNMVLAGAVACAVGLSLLAPKFNDPIGLLIVVAIVGPWTWIGVVAALDGVQRLIVYLGYEGDGVELLQRSIAVALRLAVESEARERGKDLRDVLGARRGEGRM